MNKFTITERNFNPPSQKLIKQMKKLRKNVEYIIT